MNIEHINAPETGCTPEEQAAWHAGIEAGREIERNNIAAQAQPDAGLDVEAVLRQFLTGDGFIAECDIRHIVAALAAQPAASAEPVAWQYRWRAVHDDGTLGDWNEWQPGRAPKLRTNLYQQQERPLFAHPSPADEALLRQALEALERGAWDTLSGRNAAFAIRERLGLGQEE